MSMGMLLLMERLSLVHLEQGFLLELGPWPSCGGWKWRALSTSPTASGGKHDL